MSRRKPPAEQEFGSDSFLDVIANIVGILIILIVIAGLKVARQPALSSPAAATVPEIVAPVSRPAPAVPLRRRPSDRIGMRQAAATSLLDVEAELELALQQVRAAEADTVLDTESLEQDYRSLSSEVAASEQLRDELAHQRSLPDSEQLKLTASTRELEQKVAELTGEFQVVLRVLADETAAVTRSDESLRRILMETRQLQESLATTQATPDAADRLQHRLSPVSERVEDGELHFRVEGGRISHVPLTELLERLKSQVQSRRSAVTRFPRYEGIVGPVNGYRMNYVVERDSLNALESLQHGGMGGYRISVSRWTVTPDASLESERVEDAVRRGSRFRQLVETAPPDSAATFWIYPDSFATYAGLRDVAHGLQLRVAARPLPAGTPIIGSPGGSRSSAQ